MVGYWNDERRHVSKTTNFTLGKCYWEVTYLLPKTRVALLIDVINVTFQ
jgi:hypothetical protein